MKSNPQSVKKMTEYEIILTRDGKNVTDCKKFFEVIYKFKEGCILNSKKENAEAAVSMAMSNLSHRILSLRNAIGPVDRENDLELLKSLTKRWEKNMERIVNGLLESGKTYLCHYGKENGNADFDFWLRKKVDS